MTSISVTALFEMGSPKAGNVLFNDSGCGNLRPDWPDQFGQEIGGGAESGEEGIDSARPDGRAGCPWCVAGKRSAADFHRRHNIRAPETSSEAWNRHPLRT